MVDSRSACLLEVTTVGLTRGRTETDRPKSSSLVLNRCKQVRPIGEGGEAVQSRHCWCWRPGSDPYSHQNELKLSM